MLDGWEASILPDLIDVSHQGLQLAATVCCENTNVDPLLMQSFEQDFHCEWLHFCRVLNLEKNKFYIMYILLRRVGNDYK